MAKETEKCPTCNGDGTVPGDRYTEPSKPCPTCGGDGTVSKTEARKLAEAGVTDEPKESAGE